jgi:hypothetical protein
MRIDMGEKGDVKQLACDRVAGCRGASTCSWYRNEARRRVYRFRNLDGYGIGVIHVDFHRYIAGLRYSIEPRTNKGEDQK